MAERMSESKALWIVCGVLLLGGAVLSGAIKPSSGTSSRPTAAAADNNCGGGASMAFVMSQDPVRNRIRAPSTAKFPHTSNTREIGKCEYRVEAYFDAQNAFGAMLRTTYSARMKYVGNNRWQNSEIEILE